MIGKRKVLLILPEMQKIARRLRLVPMMQAQTANTCSSWPSHSSVNRLFFTLSSRHLAGPV